MSMTDVKSIIIEWANAKAKEKDETSRIEFDETFCGGVYVRFKTAIMTSLIPDNSEGKLSGWKRPDHYAYEIQCYKTKLNLMLTFSFTNISDETKRICKELLKKYKMMPKLDSSNSDDNFYRLCIYDISIKDCESKEDVIKAMDIIFYQMKGYEKFICYKIDEEKKKNVK